MDIVELGKFNLVLRVVPQGDHACYFAVQMRPGSRNLRGTLLQFVDFLLVITQRAHEPFISTGELKPERTSFLGAKSVKGKDEKSAGSLN